MEAAYPRRWRPTRYGLAALLGGAVLLLATVSSLLSFLVSQVPARASLFGLPAVALVAAATYFGVRGLRPAHQGAECAWAASASAASLHAAGHRSPLRAWHFRSAVPESG